MIIYAQLLLAILTVAAAGVGSFVGIKVSLTEIRGLLTLFQSLINELKGRSEDHEDRIRVLEKDYFASHYGRQTLVD